MNFKRPYWLLMFISLGCLVLGFADWMLVTPDFKGAPDWRLWTFIVGEFVFLFGLIGFVASLVWMMFAAIISGVRSPHPKH
jgi:hypothetical protein